MSRSTASEALSSKRLTLAAGGSVSVKPLRSHTKDAENAAPRMRAEPKRLTAQIFRLPARPTAGVSDPALLTLQVDPASEYPAMAPSVIHAREFAPEVAEARTNNHNSATGASGSTNRKRSFDAELSTLSATLERVASMGLSMRPHCSHANDRCSH